jgi:3D (Asp-Asp-Asp) domain-containing protein
MQPTAARTRAVCLAVLASLALAWPARASGQDCEWRTMRVTFYTCSEGSSHCLTRTGNQPIPFRTVAVGDRALLGRWLYIEDLGGWVHASDTGGRVRGDAIDVFIGEGRMAKHARRLGVQHWKVGVCAADAPPQQADLGAAPQAGRAQPGSR